MYVLRDNLWVLSSMHIFCETSHTLCCVCVCQHVLCWNASNLAMPYHIMSSHACLLFASYIMLSENVIKMFSCWLIFVISYSLKF